MTDISAEEIKRILFGTEHNGQPKTVYDARFAVPNKLPDGTLVLGASLSGYSSGFSFGVTQLDIGRSMAMHNWLMKTY